ncbi:MAG: phosphoribosylanthranilate isomerase [Planctomycetota bacterium]|nr:MAG: phosphoribosylanthranilate isomerase [Planctomycetota bacterium]
MPVPRGLIGVVHLPPLPGDPGHAPGGGMRDIERRALADAEALAAGGAAALIVENFGSAPFFKGTAGQRLPPHQVAALALLARACKRTSGLPVGVNCLRNDARAAIGIAAAAELDFVRVNVHTGAYLTDQGLIEGEAARTLRYRRALGAEGVAILADVLVKHAAPLVPLAPELAVRECLERGRADAVIVTGAATGAPPARELLEAARRAAGERPVLIGSGLRPELVPALAPLADGAIAGSWLKQGGRLEAPIDPGRVRALAQALAAHLRPATPR